MSEKLPEQLKGTLKDSIDSFFEKQRQEAEQEAEKRKQAEIREIDRQHAEVLKRFMDEAPEEASNGKLPLSGVDLDSASAHGEAGSASNGSTDSQAPTPSRKRMILEVLPEFRGGTFKREDIQAEILKRWPQADSPNLKSGLSNILKDMAEKGRLERVERGPKISDPWIYRERQSPLGP